MIAQAVSSVGQSYCALLTPLTFIRVGEATASEDIPLN